MHLREYLYVTAYGKYVSPCNKVAKEELILLAAMATKGVREELHETLIVDTLDISISGSRINMPIFPCITVLIYYVLFYRGHLV